MIIDIYRLDTFPTFGRTILKIEAHVYKTVQFFFKGTVYSFMNIYIFAKLYLNFNKNSECSISMEDHNMISNEDVNIFDTSNVISPDKSHDMSNIFLPKISVPTSDR